MPSWKKFNLKMGIQSFLQRFNLVDTSAYLIGGMFCLPFIIPYHNIPIASFYSEWAAAACGLLGLLALFHSGFWHTLELPRSSLIFLSLLFISNLQSFVNPHDAAPNLPLIQSYLIWAFLLSILGRYLRKNLGWERLTLRLAWAILIAATVNVIYVLLQILQQSGLNIPIPVLQSYGMLAQSNNFADFIALSIISLLYLREKELIHQHMLVLGLFCGLLLLSLSGSRSSILYLIAILMLSWRLHRKRESGSEYTQNYQRLLNASIALLPAFIVIQLLAAKYIPLAHTPMIRAIEIINTQNHSLRWQFWQTSFHFFLQSPLLGIGVGQMRWQTYLLADNNIANPAHIFFEHSHNLFFNLLAEMGILAFFIVLVGLLFWTKEFAKKHPFNLESWWLLSILSMLVIHSMLEYPLWYSFFLGIFAFLLGTGDTKPIKLTAFSLSVKRLLSLLFLLLFIYGSQQLICMQIAYCKLEQQIAIASRVDMTEIQKENLIEDMLWVNEKTLLAPCAQLVIATFLRPNLNQVAAQLKLVESAVKFVPLRRPCINLTILLEMNHQHLEAIANLKRLLKVSNGDLQNEIQQLPAEHAKLLNILLAEIEKDSLRQ